MKRARIAFASLFLLTVSASIALAQSAPVLTVTVVGTTVTAVWTPVAGATNYRAEVGTYAGGTNVIVANVGGALSASGQLGVGTYSIRVYPTAGAVVGPVSNEVAFNVGTPLPGVPENFTATLAGGTLTFTWAAPTSGGAPTGYVLQAGTEFNWSNLAAGIPVGNTLTYSVPAITGVLPTGTYYTRLVAVNDSGAGVASDEAVFTLGNLPGVPTPLPPVVSGSTVTLSWLPPSGGTAPTAYAIEAAADDSRILRTFTIVDGSATSFTATDVPGGAYYWRIRAYTGGTPGGVFGTASFYIGTPPATPAGPRTPNPRTGRRLPLPAYAAGVVQSMASAYAFDLRNSCHETGGNNQWMFKVVRELRKQDTRWQLNWKRGNAGDLSQDIVTYNYGSLADEATTDVYIIDIIGGHCGGNPSWNFADVTERTREGNTIGRGTLVPYIAAGFTP